MRTDPTQSEETMLTFLKLAKEGNFASIDEASLEYVRIEEERVCVEESAENYYYSIS